MFVKAGKSNGECKFIEILEVKMQYGGFPTRAKTCLELVISILLPYQWLITVLFGGKQIIYMVICLGLANILRNAMCVYACLCVCKCKVRLCASLTFFKTDIQFRTVSQTFI